jgi:hypothetical protein
MINGMLNHGVVGKYAIAGAVGATFYLEPLATADVGIFVMLRTAAGSPLLSLAPIYDYLKARGCVGWKENASSWVTGLCSSCPPTVHWNKKHWPRPLRLRLRGVSRGVGMDKDKERRKRLASLSFSEKLKILEKLRDRDRAIAVSGLRKMKVPQDFQMLSLRDRASEVFVDDLLNPPPPNVSARAAARRYKKLMEL